MNSASPPFPDELAPGRAEPWLAFKRGFDRFGPAPVLILGHNDADGLSASAILSKAIGRAGRSAEIRIVRRGESAWSPEMRTEIAQKAPGGLIVADLGVRNAPVLDEHPAIVIDHHVPQGSPACATVVSGFALDPIPTSSLLAFRCGATIAQIDDLLWLAAIGIIGDMAETSGFPEMAEARTRHGVTALRNAAALLNQPRRSSNGDAAPALALLLKAAGPKDVLSGEHPETAMLLAARDEVRSELDLARRVAPRIAGNVAIIRFASECQIHPLVAQAWTNRLKGRIVIAANTGFRPGWVHFAARSAAETDLVAFLREHAPTDADHAYGGGHARASGGALRIRAWNGFARALGFGPEMQVPE